MYQVEFVPEAESDLAHLSKPIAQRVLKRLRWLAENLDAITPELLSGQWRGVFKLRVGDYRVLYTFDKAEQKIVVHLVGHRSEVYKTR
ncbi:MAG TPA: type II toxin-antitoxin system RelE/ParE family toxin [Anaerolineae bacterium]|nr:type II toxin-antitoxin system RelE/ParE family toxin [Anaerolineae bacterium]